jgi:hypothetical protein
MVRPGATTRKPRVNFFAVGAPHGVDRLPRDQHGHDGGLARAGGQLQGQAHQLWVGVVVGVGQVLKKTFSVLVLGATSVSQIAVSAASTWQKNGRTCR